MNDNSDDAISEALELLKQEKMIEDSLANGRGAWTVVYDSWRDEQGRFYGGRYACFAQPDQREMISSHHAWDFGKGVLKDSLVGAKVRLSGKEKSLFVGDNSVLEL